MNEKRIIQKMKFNEKGIRLKRRNWRKKQINRAGEVRHFF